MQRRILPAGALVLALTSACFPDYSYSEHEPIAPDTERVYSAKDAFDVSVQGLTATVSFTPAPPTVVVST